MKHPVVSSGKLAISFTEVEGGSLGKQEIAEEIVLEPIAQVISGHVDTTLSSVQVDLLNGAQKIGSVRTDATHKFEFRGILPGEYVVSLSDVVEVWKRSNW